jgi:chromosome segregation ATPase
MVHIETGVDKLVGIVDKKKKISVDDAASELGVSSVIVQEWADFLEEEGIISIEYSLSKVFLCEKKLSKKEIETKGKEYGDKKDAFIRKVETAMQTLELETKSFERLKEEFLKLKDSLGSEMNKIHDQLSSIKQYEALKRNMDDEIMKQRGEYNKVLQDAEAKIKDDGAKYEDVIKRLEKEKEALDKEKAGLTEVVKEEDAVKERMKALTKVLESMDKKVEEETNVIDNAEKKIDALEKFASKVEDEVKRKKNDIIAPLLEMSYDHRDRVIRIQDEIIAKLKERKNEIETLSTQGQAVAQKFDDYFSKKSKVEDLFKEIETNKSDLKKEMDGLIEKAKGFNISSSTSEVKKHIADLLAKYDEVEKKKHTMRKNMDKLVDILHS